MPETYKGAGVDITAGEEAVEAIKAMVRSTYRPEVIGDIGGFGGLFAFPQHRFTNPVLVSSTDGVGTKALIAQAVGRFETIGIDLVAMCVDDLVCQGAEPLFFLDYIAVGKLDPGHIKQLVKGVVQGCQEAGCALDRRRDGRAPGRDGTGRVRPRGIRRRRRRARPAHHRTSACSRATRSSACRRRACARTATRWPGACCSSAAGRPLDGPAFDGAHHDLAEELLRPSVIYAPAVLARRTGRRRARRGPHHRRRHPRQPGASAPGRRRRRRRPFGVGAAADLRRDPADRRRSKTTRWRRCSTSASA